MIDAATLTAALVSAEARVSAIEALAENHAGKSTEEDAQIVLETARRITGNLRQLLATTERRTT